MVNSPLDDENDPQRQPRPPQGIAVGEPNPNAPAPTPPPPPSPFQREQFRDAWMSTGTDVNRQNQLLDQYSLSLDKAGRTTLPTGEVMDLRIVAGSGQNLAGWTGVPGGEAKYGQQGGMGSASGSIGANGATSSGGFQDQIRAMLLQQLQGAQQPVDPNSAEIAVPYQAAAMDAQRNFDAERKALAERLYAEGNGTGSNELTQGLQQSAERTATGLASLKGQLMQRAVQARKDQLTSLLNLAMQSGDAESARAIQLQLGQLDASLRSQQLAQQANQWNDSFGLQGAQFQYQKDRDLANAGMGA